MTNIRSMIKGVRSTGKEPVNTFEGWTRFYHKKLHKKATELNEQNVKRWTALFAKPLNKWTPLS